MHYPTIVIHGFLANALTNLPIHVVLRRRGFDTYDVPIPGLNTVAVASASKILAQRVEEVLTQSNAKKVNLVGVSKGGVIALNYLRHHGGHQHIHKVVTLGSPLNGTPLANSISGLPLIGKLARELAPKSILMQNLHAFQQNVDAQVEVISIYAEGDIVVSRDAATVPEARVVKAPCGYWPVGHYQLVVDPRNLDMLASELLNTRAA